MKAEDLKHYHVEPTSFFSNLHYEGYDGYDIMEFAQDKKGWTAIGGWGLHGWDLGSWPYVIIYAKKIGENYCVLEYVEGDTTMWACPTMEIRNHLIDYIAFAHWKFNNEDWVRGYDTVDDAPSYLKGPYSNKRVKEEELKVENLIEKYLMLRREHTSYGITTFESSSYHAYNQIVIVLQNSHNLDEAKDMLRAVYKDHGRDAQMIYDAFFGDTEREEETA